jgi:Holliday junction resolvasome RuvABC endonuclease subunit
MLLSIDQSLSCSGMVLWKDTEASEIFVVKTQTGKEVLIRIKEVIDEVHQICKKHKVKNIVIEALPYGINSTSVRPLAGLYYCIANYCSDNNIGFNEANVSAVKKFATGKGNAKKSDMITSFSTTKMYERALKLGYKKTTGLADLADAYFIGKLRIKEIEDEKNA